MPGAQHDVTLDDPDVDALGAAAVRHSNERYGERDPERDGEPDRHLVFLLEFEHPLAAERPANAVREAAELGAREVALIIAGVEMVRDVEHLQTDCGVVMKYPEPLAHLHIQRRERWKAAGPVSRADEIPVFVDHRQRKSGPQVQHGEYRESARQADVAPEEVPVGCIPGQRSTCVWPDHRVLDVSEVAVEVIQIAYR